MAWFGVNEGVAARQARAGVSNQLPLFAKGVAIVFAMVVLARHTAPYSLALLTCHLLAPA